jgi:malonyl CoA-acyl carrier protein transacylase
MLRLVDCCLAMREQKLGRILVSVYNTVGSIVISGTVEVVASFRHNG